MSILRRLLHVVAGWILGLFTSLVWVWVGEGKVAGTSGGLYIVSTMIVTVLSVFLLGATLLHLAVFAVDGNEG